MKINPVAGNHLVNPYKKAASPAPSRPSYGGEGDQVSFSPDAIEFSSTIAKIKEQLDLRPLDEISRIQDIAAQVKNGTYKVDAEKVAEKIVRDYIF